MKVFKLIGLEAEIISNTKIHFAIGAKEKLEPLYQFYQGSFKEWQEGQNNKNFERDYILSLIFYSKDEWLYGGIYKRISIKETSDGTFRYKTKLTTIANDLIGRLIIKFPKKFRQSYPYLENYFNDLEVIEILREKYTVAPFPGFENIKIKFDLLKSIVSQEEKSWKTALSSVKGIYLISDLLNGKKYIGSAYGTNAFWSRWKEYADTGHGGNKEFKELIRKNGYEYTANFQFAILETRSMNAEDEDIMKREKFWKEILLSREHGYNVN